ncbi:MarR family winged helix-turn-helix transcriptional regulator [Arenicella xantha]|uniref:MarR family transcriptional regulator n=1 Tax=Arenicella xantha TaxID=644221 RepID=A0A395JSW0_9GAMM|nr:MarR family transcriptional regulator [Arenicella xantha]RBP53556.1 MarR family transcriptional regulator [Arenicella xantha]
MSQVAIPRSARIDSSKLTKSRSKQALRLWLRLFSCQSMIEDIIRVRLRDDHGITLPQFDVLAELDNADEPLTMSELSQHLVVSNGNITGVIDRLEREKFLKRVRSDQDRRVQYIQLTDSGQERFKAIAAEHETWVADLFSALDRDEVDQMINTLKKTKESIQGKSNKT